MTVRYSFIVINVGTKWIWNLIAIRDTFSNSIPEAERRRWAIRSFSCGFDLEHYMTRFRKCKIIGETHSRFFSHRKMFQRHATFPLQTRQCESGRGTFDFFAVSPSIISYGWLELSVVFIFDFFSEHKQTKPSINILIWLSGLMAPFQRSDVIWWSSRCLISAKLTLNMGTWSCAYRLLTMDG